jgi:hypothetical protein
VDDGLLALRGQAAAGKLVFGEVKFPVVILPNVERIPLATLQKFADFANGGGLLIAVGRIPSKAPGYLATAADHQAVQDLAQSLFSGPNAKGFVVTSADLAQMLQNKLRPDVAYSHAQPNLGFVHRHTPSGEIYFLVNTTDHAIKDTAILRVDGLQPEWWNPVNGGVSPATVTQKYAGATAVAVNLAPYDAQFLVFTSRSLPAAAPAASRAVLADLSRDWDVSFKNASPEANPPSTTYSNLHSWTDDSATKFFSGTATYTKQINLSAAQLASAGPVYLDFGPGQPATVGGGAQGIRANFEPPVADAAVVLINGQRVGALWCPPYRLDVTSSLKPGANQIVIQVANRAVNYMADFQHHPLPDYTKLNASPAYGGKRFGAQDMDRIEVQPSGLLGTVQLVSGN